MDPELIDRIYESSLVPDRWRGVLDELAKIAGARAGWICTSNAGIEHWDASTELAREVLRPSFASGLVERTERFARLLGARHSGFLVDYDIYTEEELANDPTYRDWLRPRLGLGLWNHYSFSNWRHVSDCAGTRICSRASRALGYSEA
jgi:hypothetical protein